MNPEEIRQELAVIRSMIERTRRQTAESGTLFIFMGIASSVFVLAVSLLEMSGWFRLVMPVMIGLTAVNGIAGCLLIGRAIRRSSVTTYSGRVLISMWVACSAAILLMTFALPFMGVYPGSTIGILAAMVFGIGMFMTGVICEMPRIARVSLVWPAAALAMALIRSPWRIGVMIAAIIAGFILPGIWLNGQKAESGAGHEDADPA
jgi:hypothetical protein